MSIDGALGSGITAFQPRYRLLAIFPRLWPPGQSDLVTTLNKTMLLGRNIHEEDFDCSVCSHDGRGKFGLCGGTGRAAGRRRRGGVKAIGCTVEETDIIAKGDGYKADDVECKDGQYDMTLDKDFKITGKEKED